MRRAFFSFVLFTGWLLVVVHADDLVTRDGTVYHDYKVLSHDAGFLTIMYSDGGGKIPLSNLPDTLQKQYGYNKQAADAAVQAAIAQDRQDRQAIANEEALHQQQMAAQAEASGAPPAALPGNGSVPAAAPAPVPDASPTVASAPATDPAPDATAPTGDSASSTDDLALDNSTELDPERQRIVDLEVEIHSLKTERDYEESQRMGGDWTKGANGDRLKQDEAELLDLKQKVRVEQREADSKERPNLTPDQVAAIKGQIKQLKIEMAKLNSQVGAESQVRNEDGNSHGVGYAQIMTDEQKIEMLSGKVPY